MKYKLFNGKGLRLNFKRIFCYLISVNSQIVNKVHKCLNISFISPTNKNELQIHIIISNLIHLFSVVHLVHVNHHQLMKRFHAHKCCSIQAQTIFTSNISSICSTQTRAWTCRIIHSSIIKCKDQL